MQYYPVYLALADRHCVVIGGGVIAEEKVKKLLQAKAKVTVIAPDLTQSLKKLADSGDISYQKRAYQSGDLAGAFVTISATDEKEVNEQVWDEAIKRNILVNVVDDIAHCNFIVPSIVRQGDLTIAISTSGKAPALAVRLRQQLEGSFGDEYARFLELAGTLRAPLAARLNDFEHRKALWYDLVDSDVLELLRQGNDTTAHQRIIEIMGVAATHQPLRATHQPTNRRTD